MTMDLRLLEYFVSAADEGSFTRAAQRLHVSQPSLSEGIRKLEGELATPLFHRVGRGTVLTDSGKTLLPRGRHILQQVAEAREEMAALRGLRGGTVGISAPPGLSVSPLAGMIGAFRRNYPEVIVSMNPTEDGSVAVKAVRAAESEIGLVDRPVQDAELVSHTIMRNEIVFAAPPGTDWGGRTTLALCDLSGCSIISTFPGTRTREVLDSARDMGVDLPVAVETPHREAVIPLIIEGVGCAFLTSPIAAEAARRGAVVVPLNPAITYDVHLIHRAKPLTRAADAFVQHTLRQRTNHSP